MPTQEDALGRYLVERDQAPPPEAPPTGGGRSVCGVCGGGSVPDGGRMCALHP